MKRKLILLLTILVFVDFTANSQKRINKNVITRNFKETIAPVELNHGEVLEYKRKDGKMLTLELLSTSANILYTNRDKIPSGEHQDYSDGRGRRHIRYRHSGALRRTGKRPQFHLYLFR